MRELGDSENRDKYCIRIIHKGYNYMIVKEIEGKKYITVDETLVFRYVAVKFYWGWAIWDNKKSRLVDGVYADYEIAVIQANFCNENPDDEVLVDRDYFSGVVIEQE